METKLEFPPIVASILLSSCVVDPNTLNLDPDPGLWPNLNPDPGICQVSIKKKMEEQFFSLFIKVCFLNCKNKMSYTVDCKCLYVDNRIPGLIPLTVNV